MTTHNISFHGKIRKILILFWMDKNKREVSYLELYCHVIEMRDWNEILSQIFKGKKWKKKQLISLWFYWLLSAAGLSFEGHYDLRTMPTSVAQSNACLFGA